MDTTLKAAGALGAASLFVLALAGGAGAQTTTGDPTLTTVFSTYNGKGAPNYTGSGISVGFDPNGGGGKLSSSQSQTTAQSVYESFVFDSSAAGAFTTLAANSTAQIQLFALNNNVNSTGGLVDPFNIYATLYAFNPNAASGTVPVTGQDLFGTPTKITLGGATGGYFSGDFKLAGSIVAGQQYVLGFTTLNSDTQDFATLGETVFNGQTGLPTGDLSADTTKFLTQTDDQGTPTAFQQTNTTANVIAFRLAAASPAAVPEASSVVSMGLLLGMGAAFVAFKRRRSVAK